MVTILIHGSCWINRPLFPNGRCLIMFGLGGVLVEVMGEVVFRVAPVSREEAIEMINEIRAGKILS
ncbi:MAG: acetate--CoA ligase family protein, partial [Deltaproteobacteria bacterium]|nr:acetate--CoA ligase family protein [Deltaproteobacteria bacterium]